jgi:membrane protease YdiL (CAAX protease family)
MTRPTSTALRWEVGLVLCLSLAKSAVFSLLDLANSLTRGPLGDQSVTLNSVYSQNPVIDALYQLSLIVFSLMPVALVMLLLARESGMSGALVRLGLGARGRRALLKDLLVGLSLFLGVGLGTLALYTAGRSLGITAQIEPSTLTPTPGAQVLLVLSAVRHGILEETIMLGYLAVRGRDLAWSPWAVILGSALLRAAYHSYQGFGPMLGNLVMGLLFGTLYSKLGRLYPFIFAHACLDITAFLASDWFSSL